MKVTQQFSLCLKTASLLTALEAAMAAVSGPRSLPPFNSPPSLLLSSSSVTDTAPGPFFFFSLARIEDSLSGNGGISSRTVAWVNIEDKVRELPTSDKNTLFRVYGQHIPQEHDCRTPGCYHIFKARSKIFKTVSVVQNQDSSSAPEVKVFLWAPVCAHLHFHYGPETLINILLLETNLNLKNRKKLLGAKSSQFGGGWGRRESSQKCMYLMKNKRCNWEYLLTTVIVCTC